MEILKEYDSHAESYLIVQKGNKKFKIRRCGYTPQYQWRTTWYVEVQLVRDFWINKTVMYHNYGNADSAFSTSFKAYHDLVDGFETNDQFK